VTDVRYTICSQDFAADGTCGGVTHLGSPRRTSATSRRATIRTSNWSRAEPPAAAGTQYWVRLLNVWDPDGTGPTTVKVVGSLPTVTTLTAVGAPVITAPLRPIIHDNDPFADGRIPSPHAPTRRRGARMSSSPCAQAIRRVPPRFSGDNALVTTLANTPEAGTCQYTVQTSYGTILTPGTISSASGTSSMDVRALDGDAGVQLRWSVTGENVHRDSAGQSEARALEPHARREAGGYEPPASPPSAGASPCSPGRSNPVAVSEASSAVRCLTGHGGCPRRGAVGRVVQLRRECGFPATAGSPTSRDGPDS
jgi:hypothetical protein